MSRLSRFLELQDRIEAGERSLKALIQRVSEARVRVGGDVIGEIQQGILVLLAVEQDDTEASADKLLHKLIHYRIFSDQEGKMNLNVQQVNGGLLIVSQFTLAANTAKGLRPSFTAAAPPPLAQQLYKYFLDAAGATGLHVQSGEFAADMQVQLTNDGPVTFMLQV